MHSLADAGTGVPAFLAKLWKLVEDADTNDLICWSESGTSFIIHNQAQLSRDLLPLYYKHNNMASFVRQLNMYGFHKKVSVDSGGLKLDKDEMEFAHPCFIRDQPYLLESIKRKIADTGRSTAKAPEVISRVLVDVKQMKGRQENLDSKLSAMKRENEALWRELAMLRKKHMKQQHIVNKLIQFLLTVVHAPNSRVGIKRRYPTLMLNDKEHHHHHHHRHKHHRHGATSSNISASAPSSPPSHLEEEDNSHKDDDVHSGPVIHELDPNSEYILPNSEMEALAHEVVEGLVSSPAKVDAASPIAETAASPLSPPLSLFEAEASLNSEVMDETSQPIPELQEEASNNGVPQASTSSSSDLALFSNNGSGDDSSNMSRDELDTHLETMQSELDGLKELLRNEGCSLDANTLLSLFAEDPIALGMGLPSQEGKGDEDTAGSELMAYNPSLFDLTDEADASPEGIFSSSEPWLEIAQLQQSNEANKIDSDSSEINTPKPLLEPPEFPEPPKKKRK